MAEWLSVTDLICGCTISTHLKNWLHRRFVHLFILERFESLYHTLGLIPLSAVRLGVSPMLCFYCWNLLQRHSWDDKCRSPYCEKKKKKARALLEGEQTCVSHLEKSARMSSTFKNKLFYPIEAHGCLLFLRQKKQKKRPDRNHWSTTLLWATQNKKISCIKFALKKNLFSNVNCSSLKDPVSINSWKQHYDASLYPTQLPTK